MIIEGVFGGGEVNEYKLHLTIGKNRAISRGDTTTGIGIMADRQHSLSTRTRYAGGTIEAAGCQQRWGHQQVRFWDFFGQRDVSEWKQPSGLYRPSA